MLFADALGRRATIIASSALMTLVVLAMAAAFALGASPTAVVVLLCLYMGTFSLGVGPFTWLVVSEITPLRYRARCMTLTVFFNRLASATVALSTLSVSSLLGDAGFFAFYGGVSLAATAWYYANVPETAGASLELASLEAEELRSASGDSAAAGAEKPAPPPRPREPEHEPARPGPVEP